MTEHANTPELRFPEFTEEWEITLLGEVSYITKLAGFEFTKYVNYSNEGKIPAIRGINIKNGRFNFEDVKYIDDSDFSKLSRSKLLPQDIVFTYVGTIGHAAIVPNDTSWYLAPNVAKIRSTNVYPDFLLQILTNPTFKRKEIFSWITTSSQPALSMANIRNFKLYLPSILEQKKVGIFFSKLDQQIELEEKKLELLEQQKKGYMQKIFSQELRFKNEDGIQFEEWSFQSLSKIFDLITDYVANGSFADIRKNVSYSEKEDYAYVIRLQDASSNWKGPFVYTNKHAYEFLSKTKLFSKDIIMSNVGTVGKTFRVPNLDKPMTLGPNSLLLRSSNNDMDFLYFYLNSSNFKKTLLKIITPGVQAKVNKTDLKTLILSIPSKEEQKKIGNFFNVLDKNIEIQGNKVNFLKQRKKGLLQKMFI